jgi:hypothetical protein
MWRAFIIVSLLLIPLFVWANSAGIEARVLPGQPEDILSVESFEIVELGETSVTFSVKTNLPVQSKLLYGDTWQKDQELVVAELNNQHQLILTDLQLATLYYYRLYLYNDKDSISLGDQIFKTAGQKRIDWLDEQVLEAEKADFKPQNQENGNKSSVNDDFQQQAAPKSGLFTVADLSFLLLCLSIFLLLLAILKHFRRSFKS